MANVPEEFDIERKLDIIARDYISKFKRKELGLTFEEDVSDMSSLPSDGELSDLSECEEEVERSLVEHYS